MKITLSKNTIKQNTEGDSAWRLTRCPGSATCLRAARTEQVDILTR